MTQGFQSFCDRNGDMTIADGMVFQLKSGVRIPVGSGDVFPPARSPKRGDIFHPIGGLGGATFVGGSGRNLIASGLAIPTSGPMPPVGVFVPTRPGIFCRNDFTLTVTGASAAVINDGTDDVAILSSGGTAPEGDYHATDYGKTTYHSGSDFTISAAYELPGGGTIPDRTVGPSAGSAIAGVFTATDAANFVSADDSDWTIGVAGDGSSTLKYQGDPVAVRDSGCPWDPDGLYVATADGKTNWNFGADWTASVRIVGRLPIAGFAYLKITESAGVLSGVDGPFFTATLPISAGDVYYVPILQCDGSAIEQFHTGLLLWPDSGGGGGEAPAGTGITSVVDGVWQTPATLHAMFQADAENLRSGLNLGSISTHSADDFLSTTFDFSAINVGSATKLQTAKSINGNLFDGTADIDLTAGDVGAVSTALKIGELDLTADRSLEDLKVVDEVLWNPHRMMIPNPWAAAKSGTGSTYDVYGGQAACLAGSGNGSYSAMGIFRDAVTPAIGGKRAFSVPCRGSFSIHLGAVALSTTSVARLHYGSGVGGVPKAPGDAAIIGGGGFGVEFYCYGGEMRCRLFWRKDSSTNATVSGSDNGAGTALVRCQAYPSVQAQVSLIIENDGAGNLALYLSENNAGGLQGARISGTAAISWAGITDTSQTTYMMWGIETINAATASGSLPIYLLAGRIRSGA